MYTTDMEYTIRKGEMDDFPEVLACVQELAEFERAAEQVTNTVERMQNERELFNVFVAESEASGIIGIAVYFFAYSTWVGKTLYLEDLYVKEAYRGQKVGSALLNKIFEVARETDCQRVRWQVLAWNTPAFEFYTKIGATIDEEFRNCDFDRQQIERFSLTE